MCVTIIILMAISSIYSECRLIFSLHVNDMILVISKLFNLSFT